jgi:hypothetical protein
LAIFCTRRGNGSARAGQAVTALAAALLLSAPLGGCQRVERLYDSKLTGDTPFDWWHQLEGGVIAEDRPPPPGAAAPYPNLDQVPGQAPTVDPAHQRTLESQLLAERDQVRRNVVQTPLSAAPAAQPAAPPPLPNDPEASHVVADAASATPAPATAPTPQATAAPPASPTPAAAAPASPPTPSRTSPKAAASEPPASATAASASLPSAPPTIPDAPPPLPQLAGVTASLAPAASRPPPPGVAIGFRRGSAELPHGAEGALQALATRRAGAVIAVQAGGDAGPSPAAQAAALPLALRRADAVRAALVAVGVPASDVRATALATARGTHADLIQSP